MVMYEFKQWPGLLTGTPLDPGGPAGPLGPGSPCENVTVVVNIVTVGV